MHIHLRSAFDLPRMAIADRDRMFELLATPIHDGRWHALLFWIHGKR